MSGTVKPNQIVMFVDNPKIKFNDPRVTTIYSSEAFLPKIRFCLGSYFDSYCFFIDDDLSVRKKTLENFRNYADGDVVLGYQGSILGDTPTPYANDTSIKRGKVVVEVDIILRTYFVHAKTLLAGLQLQHFHPELPRVSLDDVYLSLGNKYLNRGKNVVIPVDEKSDLDELGEFGVGQSHGGDHYRNRNEVCRKLMDIYGV